MQGFRTLRELDRLQLRLGKVDWHKLGRAPWVLLVTPLLDRVLCNFPWRGNWVEPRRVPQLQRRLGKRAFKPPLVRRRLQRRLGKLDWHKLGKVPWVLLVTPLHGRGLCSPPWKVNWDGQRQVPQVPLGRARLVSKRPPIARVRRLPLRSRGLWRLALLGGELRNKVLARFEAQQGLLTRLPQQPL